jgi:iron complex outermembrane receptor protein
MGIIGSRAAAPTGKPRPTHTYDIPIIAGSRTIRRRHRAVTETRARAHNTTDMTFSIAADREPSTQSKIRGRIPVRKNIGTIRALTFSTAMPIVVAAIPAHAQAVAEASVEDNAIIVTAQRRNEALEDVPMSIAVVTSETLANAGVTNLRDLATVTSGFSLGAGGAYPQPALRGVTTLINGSFENNVAVYIDGLYQPVAAGLNIDLPNVESVQVLKGPQGTLYGRNATGGALLLTTISPGPDWRGKAEVTYARFDDKRASAYVAGPLSDAIGISVAGYIRRGDGYYRKASRIPGGPNQCCAVPVAQDAVRVKLQASLSDTFTARLAYNYTHTNAPVSNVYTPIENVPPLYSAPGGASKPTELGVVAYDLDAKLDTKQHEGGLTLDWETGIGTLKSITGYSRTILINHFDFDGSYIPNSYSRSHNGEWAFQQSLDYAIDTIQGLDLIVGANYFHHRFRFLTGPEIGSFTGRFPNSPGTTPSTLADYNRAQESFFRQTKKAWAGYIDATWHVTDRLSVNGGGRYSEERQTVFEQTVPNSALFPVGSATYNSLKRDPYTVGTKFKKFTPRASIRYEISPRTNVYFTYSQGFRSGAYNAQVPACVNTVGPACYQPARQESINAYEIGFKTAGRRFRFDVAGFYYDYKDLQVAATKVLVIGGVNFPLTDFTNAPKATIYGTDGSFEFEPIENLTIRGSATWLHARYGEGFIFGAGVGVDPARRGINTNADPIKALQNASQTQDLSGLRMSRAPDFSGNIGMDYLIPDGEGGLRFAVNVKYQTRTALTNPSIWCQDTPVVSGGTTFSYNCTGVPAERRREQRFTEGPYALLSASVTWTDPTGHYYGRIWGTNLTDHKYRLHYTGNSGNGTYSPMAEPLVVGATLGYKL